MTDENDRKDENQLRKGDGRVLLKVVGRAAESLLWALAFFVSVAIPVLSAPVTNLGPIATAILLFYFGIPATVIGFILGIFFGKPPLANRALLVILCLGIMTYGWFILMN